MVSLLITTNPINQKWHPSNMKKIILYISIFIISTASALSQDTLSKLDIFLFMHYVKQNHPVVKQANLMKDFAEAGSLIAKGNFDPKLYYDLNNKYYDSKNYYELQKGGFKIPTWFGIEISGGYERNNGTFLNPENTVPLSGIIYSQISLPVLQGLLIDERRTILKQAKLFTELSNYEKNNIINELLYKAGKSYWDWHLAYLNLKVYEEAVILSQVRFEAIKKTALIGDRPPIDTIEANIQLQDRILNYQQALMDYRTKGLFLSNYLWLENDIPIELTEKTVPEISSKSNSQLDTYLVKSIAKIDSLINEHPSLKVYEFKLQQLYIEKQLKKEKLKPTLNFTYNPLFTPENISYNYENNYKWGMSFSFPVFLRKERGELKMTKTKIENTKLEALNKQNELSNKVKASINELNTYKVQIETYSRNVESYEKLWNSEKKLFESGESSLFMVNNREMSYIHSRIKLNELTNKYHKSELETKYSFGQLNNMY